VYTSDRTRDAALAAALFLVLTLAMTWPLALGLTRDIAGDFGDPLLNTWILAWDVTHLGRGWWDANIFFPHPLALAYSDHLLPQALQALPVFVVSGNPVLSYNVVFLSTFVLSGLGMFLFVRELTRDPLVSLVGGLAFAFAPYRISSLPHLQVLSSAWMPFVLLGFRRYFDTRGWRPLAGAAAAWWLQNLSSGYYLLYFSPVVILYLAWEITARGLWSDTRLNGSVIATVAAVGACTAPFVWPYLELRRLGFSPRSLTEIQHYSADVYAWFTADPNLHLWGSLAQAWPKAEGSLFPGLTVTAIAIVALARAFATQDRSARSPAFRVLLLMSSAVALALLLGFTIRLPGLKIAGFPRALAVTSLIAAVGLGTSARARSSVIAWLRTPVAFFTLITIFAIAMSFGPAIHAGGRLVSEIGPYAFFYRFVPGFDGLRVPARFGMIAAFGLAVLAPLTLTLIRSDRRRWQTASVVGALIILEAFAQPIPINQNSPDYARPGLAPLPVLGAETPAVYRYVVTLPESSAILELPLGEPAFDLRYMYYSTRHWRSLVNGYSGGQPADYEQLDPLLQDALTVPERAWTALRNSRATHVIVHESYYAGDAGPRISAWLRANGAQEIAAFGSDRVFQIP
jgi:hypothetical protein